MDLTNTFNDTKLTGLILIDKPVQCTSQDIVRRIKKMFSMTHVGHLGTLDPFASGLLPIMLGSSNRLASELMDTSKQYLFRIQLGVETDTLDMTGTIIKTASIPSLNEEIISKTLESFVGTIRQTPPAYSALKMNGRPLYEYMRASGKLPFDIETKTREINIQSCELVEFNPEHAIKIRVICSKGTYVRSLARDISIALGTVGSCSELRREKIADWCVSQAFPFEYGAFQNYNDLQDKSQDKSINTETLQSQKNTLFQKILSPRQLLPDTAYCEFPNIYFDKLNSGNVFVFERIIKPDLFDAISKLFNQSEPQLVKIFADIENTVNILFLSFAEQIDENKIRIRPKIRL